MKLRALANANSATAILIAGMTIVSEKSAPFKDFLASVTGHHWTTKGVFAIVFFIGSYFLLSKILNGEEDVKKEVLRTLAVTILAGLAISGFFLFELLGE